MEEIDFVAAFQGEEAERHQLPAYEGFQSLVGVSRSLLLISNYLTEGKIRKRAPFSSEIEFIIRPMRKGSFEAVISAIIEAPVPVQIGGSIALSITASALYDVVKTVVRRAVGLTARPDTAQGRQIAEARSGDMEALVDAVEPALSLAHTAINSGANSIVLIGNNNQIVTLDSGTREYVRTSIVDEKEEYVIVSVGSYNVNSRYGRVFLPDSQKTIPFVLSEQADEMTMRNLVGSLTSYAMRRNQWLRAVVRRVKSVDGRTKKFIILQARPE